MSPTPEPSGNTAPSLLYMVKQVELAIRAEMDSILRASGLTVLQYTALSVLARRDRLSSAQLARNSFVTAQSTSDLVKALEQQGYIVRNRDPHDRKRLLISLTPTGRAALRRHAAAIGALEERMLAQLTARQRADLRRSLNACRAALGDHPMH